MRDYQTKLVADQSSALCCLSATQVGKTFAYGNKLLAAMWEYKGIHPWWWCAPTYKQSKAGQRVMYHVTQSAGIRKSGPRPPFETNPPPPLVLVNEAVCEYRTWDNPDNLMGDPVAGVVVDEAGLLNESSLGAISTRRSFTLGPMWFIGNPGRVQGPFERLCNEAEKAGSFYRWTWRELHSHLETTDPAKAAEYLKHIEHERDTLDKRTFQRLYEAEWADWNELPVYDFERPTHVTPDVPPISRQVDLSCDFNVDPMAWIIGGHLGDEAWANQEIAIPGGATTVDACREFIRRVPDQRTTVTVYGDASGSARKTSASQTDYQIIQDILGKHYHSLEMRVPKGNPAVVDRVNAFNALLRSASGAVRYHVHPDCKGLIEDLARVSWKPGTRDIDKSDKNRTHFTDADGYRVIELYPMSGPMVIAVGTGPEDAPMWPGASAMEW